MGQQLINIGTGPNTKDGDTVRHAFDVANQNFTELYTLVGQGAGIVTADLKGSVFADDSTLLVDSVNGKIPGYMKVSDLKSIVAASTDFSDFKNRIAAL